MAFFLIGFSFLPGAEFVYSQAFRVRWRELVASVLTIPLYGMSAFGPGWGLFITLGSFNKFKTNIIKSSCLIAFGQFFMIVAMEFLTKLTESYFISTYF